MVDKSLGSDTKDNIIQSTPKVSARNIDKSLNQPVYPYKSCEATSTRTRYQTHEDESSDIDLPEIFEYENWWMEAEQPMTDQDLNDFLKQNL